MLSSLLAWVGIWLGAVARQHFLMFRAGKLRALLDQHDRDAVVQPVRPARLGISAHKPFPVKHHRRLRKRAGEDVEQLFVDRSHGFPVAFHLTEAERKSRRSEPQSNRKLTPPPKNSHQPQPPRSLSPPRTLRLKPLSL